MLAGSVAGKGERELLLVGEEVSGLSLVRRWEKENLLGCSIFVWGSPLFFSKAKGGGRWRLVLVAASLGFKGGHYREDESLGWQLLLVSRGATAEKMKAWVYSFGRL